MKKIMLFASALAAGLLVLKTSVWVVVSVFGEMTMPT